MYNGVIGRPQDLIDTRNVGAALRCLARLYRPGHRDRKGGTILSRRLRKQEKMQPGTTLATELERDGFLIVRRVLDGDAIADLIARLAPVMKDYRSAGVRALAHKVPRIRALAESQAVRSLVEPVLGSQARLIRSVLFRKDRETNWQVAWHQDLAIAVREQVETESYAGWSMKDGLVHVQPPVAVLERMLTVRLHLDTTNERNGALWVLPGSHRFGRIPAGEAAALAQRNGKKLCALEPGDALLFRPLVLHASRKAVSNLPRRVIHLEFAGISLPNPLLWNEAA